MQMMTLAVVIKMVMKKTKRVIMVIRMEVLVTLVKEGMMVMCEDLTIKRMYMMIVKRID